MLFFFLSVLYCFKASTGNVLKLSQSSDLLGLPCWDSLQPAMAGLSVMLQLCNKSMETKSWRRILQNWLWSTDLTVSFVMAGQHWLTSFHFSFMSCPLFFLASSVFLPEEPDLIYFLGYNCRIAWLQAVQGLNCCAHFRHYTVIVFLLQEYS